MFILPIKKLPERYIVHLDADAFFASVEQVLDARLKNRPVLVGGTPEGHGIVCSASYEARRFGVKGAMPMYKALKMCPNAVVVQPNFEAYKKYSQGMREIFYSYTKLVEMASIDEAYLDMSDFGEGAAEATKEMAIKIMQELKIPVSCGIASSKTVAKVASSMNKPRKMTVVPVGKEGSFLNNLPLRAIPGVGRKTSEHLEKLGFEKVSDVTGKGVNEMIDILGVGGVWLWKTAMGLDDSEVNPNRELPKSISKEHTIYHREDNERVLLALIEEMAQKIIVKLQRYEMRAKTIFLKLRYQDFQECSFQRNLPFVTDKKQLIMEMLTEFFQEKFRYNQPVRLVGVGVSNLQTNYNLTLFE